MLIIYTLLILHNSYLGTAHKEHKVLSCSQTSTDPKPFEHLEAVSEPNLHHCVHTQTDSSCFDDMRRTYTILQTRF